MTQYTFDDLLNLMANLRHPELGCSWDRKQSLTSLTAYTLEEVYEVIDAVEQRDNLQLRDELGDLLFQIVFYAQIASEDGIFGFADVINCITDKLLRRHPHIFPDGTLASFGSNSNAVITAEEVAVNWELIKNAERAKKSLGKAEAKPDSVLDDVPTAFPAINRALKLQKRAASVGFDWKSYKEVLEKLKEEIAELEYEAVIGSQEGMLGELGDVLFTCVNLARHLSVDPETALRQTNQKFEDRFRQMEIGAGANPGALAAMSNEEMNVLWDTIKKRELRSGKGADEKGQER